MFGAQYSSVRLRATLMFVVGDSVSFFESEITVSSRILLHERALEGRLLGHL